MGKFVEHDIVAHERWCLYQPPIERNDPTPRAGTPAGMLVAHAHALDRQLVQGGQLERAWRQLPRRHLPEMLLDGRPQVATALAELAGRLAAEAVARARRRAVGRTVLLRWPNRRAEWLPAQRHRGTAAGHTDALAGSGPGAIARGGCQPATSFPVCRWEALGEWPAQTARLELKGEGRFWQLNLPVQEYFLPLQFAANLSG